MVTLAGLLIAGVAGCGPAAAPAAPALVDAGPVDPEILEVARPPAAAPVALVRETGDLERIKARGALRILVYGTEETLLPRAGRSTQIDRALAEDFAARLGVRAELLFVPRFADLLPRLMDGTGDIVAARLAVTPARKEQIAFSRPTTVVKELLVGAAGHAPLKNPEALAAKTVTVRASSSYRETLEAIQQTVPTLVIADASEEHDTAALLHEVASGSLALTVSDSDLFDEVHAYEPELRALLTLQEGRQIAWGLRKENPNLKSAADAFLLEAALHAHALEKSTGDLAAIKKRGSVRILTRNNPASYFLVKGTQQGFDYELMRLFAKEHGLRVDVIVPPDSAELIPWLLEGKGDVIAAHMPITAARAQQVRFSQPYQKVDDAVLSRVQEPTLVADSDRDAPIGWATRPDNSALGAALDAFIKKNDRGLEVNVLKKKYFAPNDPAAGDSAPATAEAPLKAGAISPYDDVIRRHAATHGIDWRLMLAQAYQESRFDPKARSWVGAQGLFQVMPATGKELGFTQLEDPEQGTQAGILYMAQLIDSFDAKIPFKHRVRFALASYNAGRGHVQDARLLATQMGLDPNRWFGNVEKAMLRLQDHKVARRTRHGYCRGEEPVKYVSEIQSRYDNYLTLLPDANRVGTGAP